MSVQLGTIAPIGFEDFADPQWLACMRQLGCRVVQAYRSQSRPIDLRQIREYISSGQMPCDSLHGIYGEGLDPSSPDESQRKAAVEAFRAEGRLVRELGGKSVVVHGAGLSDSGPLSQEFQNRRWDQLARSIEELGRFGQTTGVYYAFENLPAYHAICWDVQRLARTLRDNGGPHAGMCFDTGHAHMVDGAPEGIRQGLDQIRYVHFCDNHGDKDEHLMPGEATLDLDAVARALRQIDYSGTVMLEVFHPVEKLRKLIDAGFGRKLADFLETVNGR